MVRKCAKFINLGLGLSGLSHHLKSGPAKG